MKRWKESSDRFDLSGSRLGAPPGWGRESVSRELKRLVLGIQVVSLLAALLIQQPFARFALGGDDLAAQAPLAHPRLFFTAEDIPRLREMAATTHNDIWLPIREYAQSLVGSLPPDSSSGQDLSFFRNYGDQLTTLAFACVIEDSPDLCDLAIDFLIAPSGWDQWGESNQRGLGLAHMLAGSAFGYDWLYDQMTPDQQNTVRINLATWTQRMYEASSGTYQAGWNNWWRKSYLQNFYWITNSALGLAGLALLDDLDDPLQVQCAVSAPTNVNVRTGPGTNYTIAEVIPAGQTRYPIGQMMGEDGYLWWKLDEQRWVRSDVVRANEGCAGLNMDAQTWIDHAAEQMTIAQFFLNGIGDGTWHESMTYQSYLLVFSLPFLINLREIQGVDLLPATYLQNYAPWRLYNYLSGSIEFLMGFGDFERTWGNSFIPQVLLRFIASEYGDSYAAWTAEKITAADGRNANINSAPWYVYEFFTYNPDVIPRPPFDLPLSQTFPDLEGVIWRTGWDSDALVFGFKTGAYGGRFAFESFLAGDHPWKAPCAISHCSLNTEHDHDDTNTFYLYRAGTWLAPETEGVGNYDTSFHNTLLIDGQGQYRPPEERYGEYPEDLAGSDGVLEATASAPHFDYLAANATRRYRQIDGIEDVTRYVVFVRPDYFVMVDNLQAASPKYYEWVLHFGEEVRIEGQRVRGIASDGQVLDVGIVAPNPAVIVSGNDGRPYVHIGASRLAADLRFVNLLYPADSEASAGNPSATLLADDGTVVVVRIESHTGSEHVDDILVRVDRTHNDIDAGPYRTDARVAVIRRNTAGKVEQWFIFGGTHLRDTISGALLVDGLAPDASFEATIGDATLEIAGAIPSGASVYAPDIESLIVYGASQSFTRDGDLIIIE